MCLSRRQIFLAQLSKSMFGRTGYKIQKPVKVPKPKTQHPISTQLSTMQNHNTNRPESFSASPAEDLDQFLQYSFLYA